MPLNISGASTLSLQPHTAAPDGLLRDWTYVPSRPTFRVQAIRVAGWLRGRVAVPSARELIPLTRGPRWTVYFVFAPDRRLLPHHRFTLDRLRRMDRHLLVICAAPEPAGVPDDLRNGVQGLWWKDLGGFDFSAYRLALSLIAACAPGADVLVLNDSILGPFGDLDALIAASRWQLTALSGGSDIENHVQSYCFHLRDVSHTLIDRLTSVLPPRYAFDSYRDVVYLQETRLARVAARSMSVGALWFSPSMAVGDATLFAGPALVGQGFPFLKRSLFGRNRSIHPRATLDALLIDRGHPPEAPAVDGVAP